MDARLIRSARVHVAGPADRNATETKKQYIPITLSGVGNVAMMEEISCS